MCLLVPGWKCGLSDFLSALFHSYEMVVYVWQWFIDCLQVCERTNNEVHGIAKGVGGGADILAEAIPRQKVAEHECFQFDWSLQTRPNRVDFSHVSVNFGELWTGQSGGL